MQSLMKCLKMLYIGKLENFTENRVSKRVHSGSRRYMDGTWWVKGQGYTLIYIVKFIMFSSSNWKWDITRYISGNCKMLHKIGFTEWSIVGPGVTWIACPGDTISNVKFILYYSNSWKWGIICPILESWNILTELITPHMWYKTTKKYTLKSYSNQCSWSEPDYSPSSRPFSLAPVGLYSPPFSGLIPRPWAANAITIGWRKPASWCQTYPYN